MTDAQIIVDFQTRYRKLSKTTQKSFIFVICR